jgi:hypothetical protein
MADDLNDDDKLIVSGLLERMTPRDVAEELVRRCGCTFDHRLPDDAPPVYECDYHRELQDKYMQFLTDAALLIAALRTRLQEARDEHLPHCGFGPVSGIDTRCVRCKKYDEVLKPPPPS